MDTTAKSQDKPVPVPAEDTPGQDGAQMQHPSENHTGRRAKFEVFGAVQGVGFRDFTQKSATRHGVTGWCRNTANGTVEGEAHADADVLEAFLGDVAKGPSISVVERVERQALEPAAAAGEDGFLVLKTQRAKGKK